MKKKNKKFKLSIYQIIGILLILLSVVIFIKILIPMVLGILHMFIALLKLYTLLDTTGKFFGGCFFLVVFWYIFTAFVNISYYIFNYGIKLIKPKEIKLIE